MLQPEESLEEIGIESLFSSAIVAISIFRIIHHFEKTPANRNGSKQVIDILISMWLTNFRGCWWFEWHKFKVHDGPPPFSAARWVSSRAFMFGRNLKNGWPGQPLVTQRSGCSLLRLATSWRLIILLLRKPVYSSYFFFPGRNWWSMIWEAKTWINHQIDKRIDWLEKEEKQTPVLVSVVFFSSCYCPQLPVLTKIGKDRHVRLGQVTSLARKLKKRLPLLLRWVQRLCL